MGEGSLSNSFQTPILVELDGCDRLELTNANDNDKSSLKVIGCSKLLQLLKSLKTQYGNDIKLWILPAGSGHEVLLVRELILKVKGEWNHPYPHDELCHCRAITTRAVDQAILLGAHTPEVVTRRTSASSACGTCRPDVQKIIAYRLDKKSDQKAA